MDAANIAQRIAGGSRSRARVGLALGGGGMRGLAHMGVLEVLESADVSIDVIAGTSMGGIVAGLYAAGVSVQDLIAVGKQSGIIDIAAPDLQWRGLFGHRKLTEFLANLLGDEDITFEDLNIPVALIAADVQTGEMVILDEGPLIPALLATSAFPILFAPVQHQGRWLVDGGVLNNLPFDVVRHMGADRVLAVSVPPRVDFSSGEGEKKQRTGLSIRGLRFFSERTRDWRKPFLIAEASVGLTVDLVNRRRIQVCPPDLMLTIELRNVGTLTNNQPAEVIDAGRRAAREHLETLRELATKPLPPRWWRVVEDRVIDRLVRAGRALREPARGFPD